MTKERPEIGWTTDLDDLELDQLYWYTTDTGHVWYDFGRVLMESDKIIAISSKPVNLIPPEPFVDPDEEAFGDPETKMTVADAVEFLKVHFDADIHLSWTWHCQIAMALQDHGMKSHPANRAAAYIMDALFDVDTWAEYCVQMAMTQPAQDNPLLEGLVSWHVMKDGNFVDLARNADGVPEGIVKDLTGNNDGHLTYRKHGTALFECVVTKADNNSLLCDAHYMIPEGSTDDPLPPEFWEMDIQGHSYMEGDMFYVADMQGGVKKIAELEELLEQKIDEKNEQLEEQKAQLEEQKAELFALQQRYANACSTGTNSRKAFMQAERNLYNFKNAIGAKVVGLAAWKQVNEHKLTDKKFAYMAEIIDEMRRLCNV